MYFEKVSPKNCDVWTERIYLLDPIQGYLTCRSFSEWLDVTSLNDFCPKLFDKILWIGFPGLHSSPHSALLLIFSSLIKRKMKLTSVIIIIYDSNYVWLTYLAFSGTKPSHIRTHSTYNLSHPSKSLLIQINFHHLPIYAFTRFSVYHVDLVSLLFIMVLTIWFGWVSRPTRIQCLKNVNRILHIIRIHLFVCTLLL